MSQKMVSPESLGHRKISELHGGDRPINVWQTGDGVVYELQEGGTVPDPNAKSVEIGDGMTWPQIMDAFFHTLPPEQRAGMAMQMLEGAEFVVAPKMQPMSTAPRGSEVLARRRKQWMIVWIDADGARDRAWVPGKFFEFSQFDGWWPLPTE